LEGDINEVIVKKWNKLISEVAGNYESLYSARLKALCDRLNLTAREQIEPAAFLFLSVAQLFDK
jgi:hypothetical protein